MTHVYSEGGKINQLGPIVACCLMAELSHLLYSRLVQWMDRYSIAAAAGTACTCSEGEYHTTIIKSGGFLDTRQSLD